MADPIYVVTLKSYDDLDGFYSDMKSDGFKIHMKLPISRNTQYYMTDAQAATTVTYTLGDKTITYQPDWWKNSTVVSE